MAASYLYSNAWLNGLAYHHHPYSLPYYHDLLGQPPVVQQTTTTTAAPAPAAPVATETTTTTTTTAAPASIAVETTRVATPPPVTVEPLLLNSAYHHHPHHYSAYHHATLDFPLHPETVAEIESRIQSAAVATSRAPIVKNEVIPVDGPAGRVKHIVKRLPTPAPDVINRTVVVKPHKDIVEVYLI